MLTGAIPKAPGPANADGFCAEASNLSAFCCVYGMILATAPSSAPRPRPAIGTWPATCSGSAQNGDGRVRRSSEPRHDADEPRTSAVVARGSGSLVPAAYRQRNPAHWPEAQSVPLKHGDPAPPWVRHVPLGNTGALHAPAQQGDGSAARHAAPNGKHVGGGLQVPVPHNPDPLLHAVLSALLTQAPFWHSWQGLVLHAAPF